jgi:hypothetical protein
MEAIFAPIRDVPDVSVLDAPGVVRSDSPVDTGHVQGDFAAGLRLRPFVCEPGDFATGLGVASVSEQTCDFATGLRTCERTGLSRGDFATGQRRGTANPNGEAPRGLATAR